MSIPDPELAAELESMGRIDQDAREKAADAMRAAAEIDRRNTARLHEIVDAIGWPTISRVGQKAAHWAWLLAQHADGDPDFQRRCLALMRALPPDEVSAKDIGYLDDRLRVREGRPQLYGTQFSPQPDGTLDHGPVEDPEHLDERRAAVGMGPMEEYRKGIRGAERSAKRAEE